MMDTIFGLPAHALVVHAAVVLVPVASVAVVATGWKRTWRRRYAPWIASVAVLAAVAAILAASSGEPLQDNIRDAARAQGAAVRFGEHPEQGELAEVSAVGLALVAVGLWAVDRLGVRLGRVAQFAPQAMYAVAAVVALGALVAIAMAGHSGAELVWRDVGTFVS